MSVFKPSADKTMFPLVIVTVLDNVTSGKDSMIWDLLVDPFQGWIPCLTLTQVFPVQKDQRQINSTLDRNDLLDLHSGNVASLSQDYIECFINS